MSYALKLGDNAPPLRFRCVGVDGAAADLTGVTLVEVGVRREGGTEAVVTREATVEGDPEDGIVVVQWQDGDSREMGRGNMEFEAQVTRGAEITTFPGEGYGTFEVWQDIVPEPGS